MVEVEVDVDVEVDVVLDAMRYVGGVCAEWE